MTFSFKTLREANATRLPLFRNRKGEVAHDSNDGSDWSDSDWLEALIGELGEYANVRKKMRRGDFTKEEALPMMAKELADVQAYLDLLAYRVGVDLGQATKDKFNEVSDRVGVSVYLAGDAVVTARNYNKILLDVRVHEALSEETRAEIKTFQFGSFGSMAEIEERGIALARKALEEVDTAPQSLWLETRYVVESALRKVADDMASWVMDDNLNELALFPSKVRSVANALLMRKKGDDWHIRKSYS